MNYILYVLAFFGYGFLMFAAVQFVQRSAENNSNLLFLYKFLFILMIITIAPIIVFWLIKLFDKWAEERWIIEREKELKRRREYAEYMKAKENGELPPDLDDLRAILHSMGRSD